ncbi:hypothetical protein, partial [Tahibacter sp.]|uniref:hypothetical protein n=1 Tax=Tahibacter sp. TaxID=2056211 RepID=UPI0028C4EBDF
MAKTIPQSTCPSAQPDMRDALVFGVINGTPTAPRVAYLRRDAVVPLADLPDLRGLQPGHVFRIAATEAAPHGRRPRSDILIAT